jgi:hypothetical protein
MHKARFGIAIGLPYSNSVNGLHYLFVASEPFTLFNVSRGTASIKEGLVQQELRFVFATPLKGFAQVSLLSDQQLMAPLRIGKTKQLSMQQCN